MTEVNIPTTPEALAALGSGPQFFPASFAEYPMVVPATELCAEFVDDQIVLMSYAALIHIDRQLWRSEDFDTQSAPVTIADLSIPVGEVYRELPGEEE